jgi:hypothetical protein
VIGQIYRAEHFITKVFIIKIFCSFTNLAPDRSVSIATVYGAGGLGFDFGQRKEIFVYSTAYGPSQIPTQTPVQWIPGALSRVVKRPGREADHSPPYSAEVKSG